MFKNCVLECQHNHSQFSHIRIYDDLQKYYKLHLMMKKKLSFSAAGFFKIEMKTVTAVNHNNYFESIYLFIEFNRYSLGLI